jgi:hypothetical protein
MLKEKLDRSITAICAGYFDVVSQVSYGAPLFTNFI